MPYGIKLSSYYHHFGSGKFEAERSEKFLQSSANGFIIIIFTDIITVGNRGIFF